MIFSGKSSFLFFFHAFTSVCTISFMRCNICNNFLFACIYPKNWDIATPSYSPPNSWQVSLSLVCLKLLNGWPTVDPDQIRHSAASDLGLHCLLRSVCPIRRMMIFIHNWVKDTLAKLAVSEYMYQSCREGSFFNKKYDIFSYLYMKTHVECTH